MLKIVIAILILPVQGHKPEGGGVGDEGGRIPLGRSDFYTVTFVFNLVEGHSSLKRFV